MQDSQLSFRKSANIDRVTDKRKDSLFRLVDTDGSGTIDAQEFAVLYDAIKKDLAEELEKEAVLQQEASSARRRFKMLLLFVAVLVSFLAASVAANFAVIFTVVDDAITTTTTSSGILEVKGSDTIAKTALATEDVPMIVAPVLDINTLGSVKTLQVTYGIGGRQVEAQVDVVAVRKHNTTFVEFITSVPGETVEALNGEANYVVYPTASNKHTVTHKYKICAANATCSAFKASGIDTVAAFEMAKAELEKSGFIVAARRLQGYSTTLTDPYFDSASCASGTWETGQCTSTGTCHWSMKKMRVMYYTGYSGTRHVVFFFHGLFATMSQTWDIFCPNDSGSVPCTPLKLNAFRHLVFVWASSSAFPSRWGTDPTNSLSYKDWGAQGVMKAVCGRNDGFKNAGRCDGSGSGYVRDYTYGPGSTETMNVGNMSQIMVVGYSDGGGLATFMNWAHGTMVTKAVALDYHGFNGYATWLSHSAICGTGLTCGLIALKAYTTCESMMYTTDAITTGSTTMVSEASLSGGSYTATTYGGAAFKEFLWQSNEKYLKWAIHGLTGTSPGGACDSSSICPGSSCTDVQYHDHIMDYHGAIDDIMEWVTAPSPPPLVTASPSPPPPLLSPSPPPPSPVSYPECDGVKWCCPVEPAEWGPFTCTAHGFTKAGPGRKQCVGPGDYVVEPVPCRKLPWFEVCEVFKKEPREAREMASRLRPPMALEEIPCVVSEVCDIAQYSIEKAMHLAYDMGLEPEKIHCLARYYKFYLAMPGPMGTPSECDYMYICSLLDTDRKKAFDLAMSCHRKKSPYELPGC